MLFDKSTWYWSESYDITNVSGPYLPEKRELEYSIEEFKKSLVVSEQQAREIERSTCDQRHSSHWFEVRHYRLTAPMFGEIFHRKPDTPPDALVYRILEQRQFTSPATQWGQDQEKNAVKAYQEYQRNNGHPGLTVCPVGFYVSLSHHFLGASPDCGIYDPTETSNPYGF